MKTSKTLAVLTALACCLGAGAHTAWAQESDHDHSAHHVADAQQLKLNHGKKWETDANLHLGMERIRDALAAGGKMSARQYLALAQNVNEQISFIAQNCRLDKQTDAMLHLVLADLVAGADAIYASGDEHSMHHGAEKISNALKDYGIYFEHPGWHDAVASHGRDGEVSSSHAMH
ncbi:MAG: hypothetical protein ABII63_06195 [Pseudomonadota bacterium]